MKKSTFVLISLFPVFTATAQEVVSSQGESYSNSTGSIVFTIGEVITSTETDGSNDITQGFHQTNWNFLGIEDNAPEFFATIFPNPTEDILNIKTATFEGVTYSLYDANGKLVIQNKLEEELTVIRVDYLAPGTYSLVLFFEDQNESLVNSTKQKTFKLVKSH